jgi:hypothetical protein
MGVETIVYNFREKVPSLDSVKEACSLANRMGMTSVIGIGPVPIIDLAKGTQYLLETRRSRFPHAFQPLPSSSFKVPLICFPTTPLSSCYQPTITLTEPASHMLRRYPLSMSPQRISLIPSLVSRELSSDPFLCHLSPSEVLLIHYFSLLSRFLDLFFSRLYLRHTDPALAKAEEHTLGEEALALSRLCQLADSLPLGGEGEGETVYEHFHRFNSHAASLRLSFFQSAQALHPTTSLPHLSLLETCVETATLFQHATSTTRAISPLPSAVWDTLSLHEYLALVLASEGESSKEARNMREAAASLSRCLGGAGPELLLEQMAPLVKKIRLVQEKGKRSQGKNSASQISFLLEEKVQWEADEQAKEAALLSPELERVGGEHMELLQSDAFATLAEETLR